ncbi:MAG: oxidoreductase [Actinobacteria bacterium]|nr:oxidoreductase [Actinomycetota bacterium]
MSYRERLLARQREVGRPVRVALVGAGQMGRGLAAQVGRMPGLQVSVVADVDPGRAEAAFKDAGVDEVVVDDGSHAPGASARAVEDGKHVVLRGAESVASLAVDVVVDATGVPNVGAELTLAALLNGKDVVGLNVESDVTIGILLAQIARATGQVYTIARGDEPVETKKLVDFARDLNFEIIFAGKGKNNPFRPHETPDSLEAEAAAKKMNPKMLCEFVDGSKAMIEMASLANTTGLEVSRRGMYGPESTVPTLHETFRLKEDGGVLDRPGVVDYCTGPVAPGVFVVVRSDHPYVVHEMSYLSMGEGPYFSLYRPYHLASIEAPLSIPEAVLDRTPSLITEAWTAEVAAAAKKDLAPGDTIDGIGGYCVRGMIEDAAIAKAENLVPLGILNKAKVVRPVARDQVLTYDDVELDESSTVVMLRRLQDRLLAGGGLQLESALRGFA